MPPDKSLYTGDEQSFVTALTFSPGNGTMVLTLFFYGIMENEHDDTSEH